MVIIYIDRYFFLHKLTAMENRLLTTLEVAERLGVHRTRVNVLIQEGRLPATRYGKSFLVQEADLALVSDRKAGRPKKEGAAEADQVDQVKPVKVRSAKSLTEAERKRIRDEQQQRWAGQKATKKGGKK